MIYFLYESPQFNIKTYIPFSKPAVEFGDSATRLIRGFFIKGIAMPKKLNTSVFIEKAKKVHGNIYNYSKSIYRMYHEEIEIICKTHGSFWQKPAYHLSGSHCPECAIIKRNLSKQLNTEIFIKKAVEIHGNKYDYSKSIYTTTMTPLEVICKKHGSFFIRPNNHFSGAGCHHCADEKNGFKKRLTTKEFIERSKKQHGSKYDYSESKYITANTKIKIRCKKHGYFYQLPDSHFNGKGCMKCRRSMGEISIIKYLESKKIKYIEQKKFKNCKNIRILSFDFYIPSLNMCIEYDGLQHFKSIERWGGEKVFNLLQKRDEIKNNFCKNANIKLLRIAYNEDIEKKLVEAGIV